MDRRRFLGVAGAGTVGLAGCLDRLRGGDDRVTESPGKDGFRVVSDGFECVTDGTYEELLVRGVNLGMAKPGRFPGEAAITRAEYDRWLAGIGELGANVIRTYTIHPPAFYEALAAYNSEAAANGDELIFLLQGSWISEESLIDAGDVRPLADEFDAEHRRTVDVVHGNASVDPEPGRAAGTYDVDVSAALLGYIIGIEWLPEPVIETNEAGGQGRFDGRFFTSSGSAFERWLAGRLDELTTYEYDSYDTQRPVAFTNWPTTDPLEHPYEPFELEDAVTVDPDAVTPTGGFEAGTFGAYHVYPYYPDFLNHTPEYVEYTDHRGEPNSYAGYLSDLVDALEVPLLVAEFGVPSSRGIAHRHVHGRDQGRHTEREQGEIVAAMYEDIVEAGTAGGIAFVWQDEWFKRTWNLGAFSNPDRRPFWSNIQTPEQQFGLLAFDPVGVTLDGSDEDWEDATRFTPASGTEPLGDGGDDARELVGLDVTHDVAGLALRLEFASLPDPVDWTAMNALVALGLTGRGNTTLPLGTDATVPPTDFLVRLGGPDDSRLRVDARYDAFAHRYGDLAGLDMEPHRTEDSGVFTPSRMVLNLGYTVPPTGEEVPFDAVETGRLRYGVGNPDHPAYDSLADVHVAPRSNVVELRLPWLLLNVSDPSSRYRLADLQGGDPATDREFDALSIAAATYAPDGEGTARELDGPTNLTHAVPGFDGGGLGTVEYTWERWNEPAYRERRKESYDLVRDTFESFRG